MFSIDAQLGVELDNRSRHDERNGSDLGCGIRLVNGSANGYLQNNSGTLG